jgi:cell division protein FtsL
VKQRPFLALWTLAVVATVTAFVVHLALRGRTVDLGYKLGRARAEQARLREVKRVLSLEAASYETPQRVEMVARTLLGMTPPPPERVIALRGPVPMAPSEDQGGDDPVVPQASDAGAPVALDAGAAPADAGTGASVPATPGVILPRGRP